MRQFVLLVSCVCLMQVNNTFRVQSGTESITQNADSGWGPQAGNKLLACALSCSFALADVHLVQRLPFSSVPKSVSMHTHC